MPVSRGGQSSKQAEVVACIVDWSWGIGCWTACRTALIGMKILFLSWLSVVLSHFATMRHNGCSDSQLIG
jgi:hypothetical protein